MYSGAYSSHRYSPLTQITPANVAKLNAPIVQQREALVRVFVQPGAGWSARPMRTRAVP